MKPILFNTEMVRAIMDGRKTVTRRVVKDADPLWNFDGTETNPAMEKVSKNGEICPVDMTGLWAIFESDGYIAYPMIKAPYQPGNILYVRETWNGLPANEKAGIPAEYWYKADEPEDADTGVLRDRWHPSIHMPREAARLFLRVTGVRVERLQDIDDDGVVAEGLEIGAPFDELWDSTIKPANLALYGWEANPWVWVIEFERISKDEALKDG